jgi:hypothetical protein
LGYYKCSKGLIFNLTKVWGRGKRGDRFGVLQKDSVSLMGNTCDINGKYIKASNTGMSLCSLILEFNFRWSMHNSLIGLSLRITPSGSHTVGRIPY